MEGARAVAEAAAAMDTEVAAKARRIAPHNSNAAVVGLKTTSAGVRGVVATAEGMAAVEWIMVTAVKGAWG